MPNQPHSPSAGTTRRSGALNALLTHHRAALYRQAVRHSHRPDDAEDALQDACLQFMRSYDGPPGTDALRWMLLVTKRCAWAIGTRQRSHESQWEVSCTDADVSGEPTLIVADESPDPALYTERAEQQAARLAALRRLKSDRRTALFLLGLGLSYREIAERKGWTQTKVNRCLAEGRVALRTDPDLASTAPFNSNGS
jgi:RNA polymerase sigma factor (sigma-70 family)